MISAPVCESRFPVGSSARMTRGPFDEGPRDRHALLLSTGEVGRQVGASLGEPDLLEEGQRPRPQLPRGDPDGGQPALDVLDGGQRRNQVELLEHEAERSEAKLGEVPVAERPEVAALEQHAAVAWAVERAEQLQQRRLPRSARPLERDELAGLDLQVDAVEGLDTGGRDERSVRRPRPRRGRRPSLHLPERVRGPHPRGAQPPAAPATRPPTSATRNPRSGSPTATGAVSATWSVTLRALTLPSPRAIAPAGAGACGERRPERADSRPRRRRRG